MASINTSTKPDRLKRLFHRLVDIYSPSGKEEEILHFLQGYLKRRGIPVHCQSVSERRYNLLMIPPEKDIRLALIGHVDTVTAYDLDDYAYKEKENLVKGLGTADMKGGCAAMVEAFTALWESGGNHIPAALCLLVGEEEEGDGAERLAEDYHFPWAIIGEPTALRPCLSHYGYIEAQICTFGKRMHASLAHLTRNPVEAMLHLMLRLTRHMERDWPDLVYNIRDLFSSPAGFAVPDRCEAWLDLHLPPSAPLGAIATEMEEVVCSGRGSAFDPNISFRTVTIDAGYELPEKGSVVEALKAACAMHSLPWEPQAFRSHSDANRLWSAGMKPVLLGPGRLEMAHSPDESVSFEEVCLGAEIYLDLLLHLSEYMKSSPALTGGTTEYPEESEA
jgi:acetylornithine deacetylase